VSDLDLANLVKLGTSPGKKKDDDTDALNQVRRKIDGQITEYTEGSGEGIDDVETMLKADPDNVDLQDWLAFLYYTNNRLDEAIDLYKKLLASGHKADTQYFYLGNAYYKKGLSQLAVEQWKKSLEVAPTGPMARKAQARIDEATG